MLLIDTTSDNGIYNAARISVASANYAASKQEECTMILAGITKVYIPVVIRRDKK